MTSASEPAVIAKRRGQFSQPSVAEMVADVIRARIVAGTLPDGSMLPKQDQLISEFQVSRPSFREALRILESEGLISVRRGNVGGAQVHTPTPENAARTLGLVLQAHEVALDDLAAALAVVDHVRGALRAAPGSEAGARSAVPRAQHPLRGHRAPGPGRCRADVPAVPPRDHRRVRERHPPNRHRCPGEPVVAPQEGVGRLRRGCRE